MTYNGEPVTITSTLDAINLGIATVYQEPQLFAELTVAENIFMGREMVTRGRVDWTAQNEAVVTLLESLDLPASLATAVVGTCRWPPSSRCPSPRRWPATPGC